MSKVNQLLVSWPQGAVVTQAWLDTQGVNKTQAHKYQKSQWLERVGHGAWQRCGDQVDWLGAVYGLQQQAVPRIWPGGLTALSLAGYAHYLPLGGESVNLFGVPGSGLPSWFREYDWGVKATLSTPNLFNPLSDSALIEFMPARANFKVWISSAERAVFELLYATPDALLFETPLEILNGLASLSPKLVQALLEACRSVKVKRVFLVLARHCNHAWYRRLNLARIDLGKGKRQIVSEGRLDKEFFITVPERFAHGA